MAGDDSARHDPIDGTEAEAKIRFGLDGVNYEIELSAGNAAALRQAFEPYVQAGRVVRRHRR